MAAPDIEVHDTECVSWLAALLMRLRLVDFHDEAGDMWRPKSSPGWALVGFLIGLFWVVFFLPTIGGVPGSPGLGIAIWLSLLTCPAFFLGYFFGLGVFLIAPFGNAAIYGLAALICYRIRDRHFPRFLSITGVDQGKGTSKRH